MLRPPHTAAETDASIWHPISENTFRTHLVQLEEKTNAVPIEPKVFPLSQVRLQNESVSSGPTRQLSIEDEHQIAEDFAFLAAVKEGAQSVAAACVEEHVDGLGLTIRFAAMDAVQPRQQDALLGIARVLTKAVTEKAMVGKTQDRLYDLRKRVVRLHQRRIVARLRSIKWPKPRYLAESHKKPLWKDFDNLIHRAQFLYTKREKRMKIALQVQLRRLAHIYEEFEEISSDPITECRHLLLIVEESFRFCTGDCVKIYSKKLEEVRTTAQVAAALKCLRQIEKISAYWRIPQSLLQTAKLHPGLFSSIDLQFLVPYASIPTTISYESWAKTCHVHAEVQLVVHDDMYYDKINFSARVIGTSKYMCFLCFLFIEAHGSFAIANTHGRLYDQWTIPDSIEYTEMQTVRYRQIIQQMDSRIAKLSEREPKWRPEPMTSRQDLSKVQGSGLPWGANRRVPKPNPFIGDEGDFDHSAVNLPKEQRVFW